MSATHIKDAMLAALIAAMLALPLAGVRTFEGGSGLAAEARLSWVAIAAAVVFVGRLLLTSSFRTIFGEKCCGFLCRLKDRKWDARLRGHDAGSVDRDFAINAVTPAQAGVPFGFTKTFSNMTLLSCALFLFALIFPIMPFANRYALDVAIMVLTYIMLAWGLNITVGFAGLLDLGFAGFYALGAYSYALLAQHYGVGFWAGLPIAGGVAVLAAVILGLPVLRLRGDYFAIVTLGFGEIVRLVLINWTELTNGPNGISGVPRPTLFGLEFAREASEGHKTFHDFLGMAFDPAQRVVFLYYIILALALVVGVVAARLRTLPIGRAWEAHREDEIACASLGINRTWVKLAAYALGALVAGLAGAFFATRQGFVSPESFTFNESAIVLAIAILGGMGHPLGIVFAAIFIIGMPEMFRGLEQFRMVAFGLGMVLIMLWRPGGLTAERKPTVLLEKP